jgi:hypothetical protein
MGYISTSINMGILPATPALTDPGLIADGQVNVTIIAAQVSVSDGNADFICNRGDVIALPKNEADILVAGGLVTTA